VVERGGRKGKNNEKREGEGGQWREECVLGKEAEIQLCKANKIVVIK
jgi:hypothetical protein